MPPEFGKTTTEEMFANCRQHSVSRPSPLCSSLKSRPGGKVRGSSISSGHPYVPQFLLEQDLPLFIMKSILWWQYAPLKCPSNSTRLHGDISHKAVIFKSILILELPFVIIAPSLCSNFSVNTSLRILHAY